VNSRPIVGKVFVTGWSNIQALPAPTVLLKPFSYVLFFLCFPEPVFGGPMWKAVTVRWCGKRATGQVQPAGICDLCDEGAAGGS